jgi:nicotinate-nucleotide adenylyltransferase
MNTTKPNDRPRRTGLFGGTFNPIHIGHRQVAMDVLEQFQLDHIYFIPSAQPPHKSGGFLASSYDRLQMVRLALKNDPQLKPCAMEIKRGGPSFSWDTVLDFKARQPNHGQLYFLVGADAFLEIHTWKKFDGLFDQTAFIVMSRPSEKELWSTWIEKAIAYVQQEVSPGYGLATDNRTLVHRTKQPIHFAAVTPVNIAATRLRWMLQNRQPIDRWVAPAVADYIAQKGLYQ